MKAWFVTLLLDACATTSPFTQQQLADTHTSIAIAERAGARRDPHAAPYLDLAHRRLRDADHALSRMHYDEATTELRMAQADANLATALAREGARP